MSVLTSVVIMQKTYRSNQNQNEAIPTIFTSTNINKFFHSYCKQSITYSESDSVNVTEINSDQNVCDNELDNNQFMCMMHNEVQNSNDAVVQVIYSDDALGNIYCNEIVGDQQTMKLLIQITLPIPLT